MPNTANLALPYPVSSDTSDVPRDIKALADKLDITVPPAANATVALASLPAPAFDGQILFYQLPAAANYTGSIIWQFRGRPGSTNANKWEFIGGAPLSDVNNNVVAVGETVNVPHFTLPLAGDYLFRHGVVATTGVAGQEFDVRMVRYGTGIGVGSGFGALKGTAQITGGIAVEVRVDAVLLAGDAIGLGYTGAGSVSNAFLSVVPIRVR